jgi:hypothetical protein
MDTITGDGSGESLSPMDAVFAQESGDSAAPLVNYETDATRTITKYEVVIEQNVLVVKTRQTEYTMRVVWPPSLLELAMFYDVREFIAKKPPLEIVTVYTDTLRVVDGEGSEPAIEHPLWSVISELKYKAKEKRIGRAEKIINLIAEVGTLNGQILSAQMHLRSMQSASPTPHVETGVMTLGSVQEQAAQSQVISDLEATRAKKLAAIDSHVAAINEKLAAEDTNWNISLPEVILEITALNPPYRDTNETEED